MEALLDNDILYKLARYDLIADLDGLLRARSHTAPYGRLASAPFSLRATPARFDTTRWPDPTQAVKLCAFLSARTVGVDGTSTASLLALNVPAFDVGEVQLVAYALDTLGSLFYTGDKKALQAMATGPALSDVSAALQQRVVCLEQVVRDLSESLGWSVVARRVTAAAVDTTLTQCFRASTEAIMKINLNTCIDQLRARAGGLLVP